MDFTLSLKQGIYIAYPTTSVLKSIYKAKDYKTKVNNNNTKVGITKKDFKAAFSRYMSTFDKEVQFVPIAIIDRQYLTQVEDLILIAINNQFPKVGRAREWFDTADRAKLLEIIKTKLAEANIEHNLLAISF